MNEHLKAVALNIQKGHIAVMFSRPNGDAYKALPKNEVQERLAACGNANFARMLDVSEDNPFLRFVIFTETGCMIGSERIH
jgi:hypothetical protein